MVADDERRIYFNATETIYNRGHFAQAILPLEKRFWKRSAGRCGAIAVINRTVQYSGGGIRFLLRRVRPAAARQRRDEIFFTRRRSRHPTPGRHYDRQTLTTAAAADTGTVVTAVTVVVFLSRAAAIARSHVARVIARRVYREMKTAAYDGAENVLRDTRAYTVRENGATECTQKC